MGELNTIFAKRSEANKNNSDLQAQRINRSRSKTSSVDRILYLQRTIGNQAVSRLIRSKALQAKLRIGQPGDVYEQEADRVADEVMRMPEPEMQRQVEPEEEEEEIFQTKPLVDQITPVVQRQVEEEEEEEEEMLQAKSSEDATSEVSHGLESQINAIKGGGRPLGEFERAYYEPRFGADFSQVRVHTDSRAAEAAQAVNARAFTNGSHIVFGKQEYAPTTTEGRRLLAHELTHTIQQSNNRVYRSDRLVLSDESSVYESEANAVAAEITRDVQLSPHMANRVFQSLARNSNNPEWASQRARSLKITPVTHELLSRIRIRDCSATSTPAQDPTEVQAAHNRALEMLNHAISLSNSPNQAVITAANNFFRITVPPTTYRDRRLWNRVLYNLDKMAQDHNRTYQCGPQSGRYCSTGARAWAAFRIHLCHPWWTSYSEINHRAAILTHEWVHASGIMWSKRRDIYCNQSTYASLTSRQRVSLPDAYMQYIYRLYTGSDFCW